MRRALVAPMLLILASHQAAAQDESSKRAYFGVQLQPGALVRAVADEGPAEVAGIERGDLIIGFDGKVVKSSDELLQAVAAAQIGKEVVIGIVRRGQEGMTTVKLGERLVLSGAALDEYRSKLDGMLQELGALGTSKGTWSEPELQRFSELLERFEKLKKAAPPEDGVAQNLWHQLDREFRLYKPLADNMRQQREAQQDQSSEAKIEDQLGPLYVDYMTLQVCAERFQEFDKVKTSFREFLKNKQSALPSESADKLWNAIAVKFQKVEASLDQPGSVQLYGACERASKQAIALMMPVTAQLTSEPPLRRKDF